MYTHDAALDDALHSVRRIFIRSLVGSTCAIGAIAACFTVELPDNLLTPTPAQARPQQESAASIVAKFRAMPLPVSGDASDAGWRAAPSQLWPVTNVDAAAPQPAPQPVVFTTTEREPAPAAAPITLASVSNDPASDVIPTTIFPDLPKPADVKPADGKPAKPAEAKAPEAPKAPPPPPTPAERLGLIGKSRVRAEKCLAQAVYFEARAEPVKGQMAVAQVVMNRVFSPYYPKDVCSVVYQNAHRHLSCQFTFACDGKPETIRERGAWARATRIAKQTLDAKIWVPAVAKSTHYHATYVHPVWIRDMRRMARLGIHIFYRPRIWGDGAREAGWGHVPETKTVQKIARR
jgi:spore germination cell wall hydrolase CwlJ-like protein